MKIVMVGEAHHHKDLEKMVNEFLAHNKGVKDVKYATFGPPRDSHFAMVILK